MNILALNWNDLSNPYAGGAEVHLAELLRRLVAYGHRVTLFCSNYPGGKPEEVIAGIRIVRRGNRYNFNLIAPHVQMPSHLQHASCLEANGQGAVFAFANLLAWMEHEITCRFCRTRRELPNDLDRLFFPNTE